MNSSIFYFSLILLYWKLNFRNISWKFNLHINNNFPSNCFTLFDVRFILHSNFHWLFLNTYFSKYCSSFLVSLSLFFLSISKRQSIFFISISIFAIFLFTVFLYLYFLWFCRLNNLYILFLFFFNICSFLIFLMVFICNICLFIIWVCFSSPCCFRLQLTIVGKNSRNEIGFLSQSIEKCFPVVLHVSTFLTPSDTNTTKEKFSKTKIKVERNNIKENSICEQGTTDSIILPWLLRMLYLKFTYTLIGYYYYY